MQIKPSISPSHRILASGRPVPALTLIRQAPCRVATGVPIFKSLVCGSSGENPVASGYRTPGLPRSRRTGLVARRQPPERSVRLQRGQSASPPPERSVRLQRGQSASREASPPVRLQRGQSASREASPPPEWPVSQSASRETS